jgi:hypothetical protein
VKITLFGNLFDNATGAWALGGQGQMFTVYYSYSTGCATSHSSFSGHGSQNISLSFGVSITGGDQYLFYTGLDTSASASASCSTWCNSGLGSASVDVASKGYGARVLSMGVV